MEKELLINCNRKKRLYCFGAGDYAGQISVFLKMNGLDFKAYYTTKKIVGYDSFFCKPLDIIEKFSEIDNDYLMLICVQDDFHTEIINTLQKYNIKNYFLIKQMLIDRLNCNEQFQREKFLSWILYNQPSQDINDVNEKYEKRIAIIQENHSGVEIRYAQLWNISCLIENYIYYAQYYHCEEKFLLLYPLGPTWTGKPYYRMFSYGGNPCILNSFFGDSYDTLHEGNILFWKYFIKRYSEFFQLNLSMKLMKETHDRIVNLLRCGKLGELGRAYYHFSYQDEMIGKRWLDKHIEGNKFVCIFSRDAAYTNLVQQGRPNVPNIDIAHFYRNSDINNFSKACRFLKEKQLETIRMGQITDKPIDIDGCYDYANKSRTAFLDLYLNSKCEFIIGDMSGALYIATLFSRPTIYINNTQILSLYQEFVAPTFLERDLSLPLKLWDKKRNKFLTLKEMLHFETEYYFQFPTAPDDTKLIFKLYYDNGIVPIYNSPNEILAVVMEMFARINGTIVYEDLDYELQKSYMSIVKEFEEKDSRKYWYPLRIGASFLRDNPWFLE